MLVELAVIRGEGQGERTIIRGHEGLGDLQAQDLREAGGVAATKFQRLAEAQLKSADRSGGAEFVALEGHAGADALGELATVFLGGAHGVFEQGDGVMRTGEVEISRGGREHGLATLGLELMLGREGGLLGGETTVDGFTELERDAQGGAGRERFFVHVQDLTDDVLQLA